MDGDDEEGQQPRRSAALEEWGGEKGIDQLGLSADNMSVSPFDINAQPNRGNFNEMKANMAASVANDNAAGIPRPGVGPVSPPPVTSPAAQSPGGSTGFPSGNSNSMPMKVAAAPAGPSFS